MLLRAEFALETLARFRAELCRRGVVNFIGMIVNGLMEESELLLVALAPCADQVMQSHFEPRDW